MPKSRIIFQLAGKWETLIRRIEAGSIPPEGLSLAEFEAAFAKDVDRSQLPEIVRLLARRGVLWASWRNGVPRVFARKPSNLPAGGYLDRSSASARLMARVWPHVVAMALGEPFALPGFAKAARDGAQGMDGAEARRLLWGGLNGSIMAQLARADPQWQAERVEPIRLPPARPLKRRPMPRDWSQTERLAEYVRRNPGWTVKALSKLMRPRVNGQAMSDMLESLEKNKQIVSIVGRVPEGRTARRYYAPELRPFVTSERMVRTRPA